MSSYKHKEYGQQNKSSPQEINSPSADSDSSLLAIILTTITAVIFLLGLFFVFGTDRSIQKEEQKKTATLKSIAEKYNFSGTKDVVDSGYPINAYTAFLNYVESVRSEKSGYDHSILDVIGANVKDISGDKVGIIQDILVHRWNRNAKALIIDQDNKLHTQDLEQFHFAKHTKNSTAQITTKKDASPKKIHDQNLDKDHWISLQQLQNGQVVDYEEKIVGKINAVIYGSPEVQGFYFDLCPSLKRYQSKPLYMPFSAVQFVEHENKIDIMLTKEQTYALSRCLLKSE